MLLVFARKAKELGGTVTAEHGIGKIKVEQLQIMLGPEAVAQMVAVKKALDPAGILGVGNIFEAPDIDESPKPKGDKRFAQDQSLAQLAEADPFINGAFEGSRLAWAIRTGLNDGRIRVKAITLKQIEKDFADAKTAWLMEADMRSGMRYIVMTPLGEARDISLRRLERGNITRKDWIYSPENPNGI